MGAEAGVDGALDANSTEQAGPSNQHQPEGSKAGSESRVASLTQAAPGREQPEYWVERGFFSNLDPAYIKVIIDVFAFEVLFYDFV